MNGGCSDFIYPQELDLDDIVEIKYLNRIIEFRVVEFEESKAMKVSKAINSSLLIGDVVFVHHLKVGEKLIADKVYRNGLIGNYRHYKIFCVNGKYGIHYGFRIFLFNSFAK